MSTTHPEWIDLFTKKFTDAEILNPAYAVSNFRDGRAHCKLCETWLPNGTEKVVKAHLKEHARELRAYRSRKNRALESERIRNLSRARRARAEQKENDDEEV